MVADELDYVVGVDTHRDEHVLAVVAAPVGTVVARRRVAANARGHREALNFAAQYAAGARAWAVEGAGHYGAGAVAGLDGAPQLAVACFDQAAGQPPGQSRLAVARLVDIADLDRRQHPSCVSSACSRCAQRMRSSASAFRNRV